MALFRVLALCTAVGPDAQVRALTGGPTLSGRLPQVACAGCSSLPVGVKSRFS